MWHTTLWRRLDARWLIALIGLEVLAYLFAFVPPGDISSVGAGLGDYAASLATGHGYSMSLPCGQLDHARRMPIAPLFLAAVALAGGGVWAAVIARLALLLALLVAALAVGTRPGERWWQSRASRLLLGLLAGAPLFAKHLAQLGYEEGFSIVVVPALLLLGMGVLDAPAPGRRRVDVGFGALLGAVFLVKSGLALLWLAGCFALVWAALRQRRRSAWLGLLLSLAAPLGWLAFVLDATGRASLGTSWDGENLFRGWCQECSRVYPWQSLDRLFDSETIATPRGAVQGGLAPLRCSFPDEWAWNDHYRDRALAWASAAPGEAVRYLARKVWVVLLEVRPVPLVGGLDVMRSLVVIASFVVLRAAALGCAVLAWRERARLAAFRPQLVFASAGCLALCVPLLVGFAYDRHSIVLLVAFVCAAAGVAHRAASRTRDGEPLDIGEKAKIFR